LLAASIWAKPSFAQTFYVDTNATGADDGSSWCDAFVYLQDAINAAAISPGTITEIHVASGVYLPDHGSIQVAGDQTARRGAETGE